MEDNKSTNVKKTVKSGITFGIKPRYITEIFVDKENAELASHIIHTL